MAAPADTTRCAWGNRIISAATTRSSFFAVDTSPHARWPRSSLSTTRCANSSPPCRRASLRCRLHRRQQKQRRRRRWCPHLSPSTQGRRCHRRRHRPRAWLMSQRLALQQQDRAGCSSSACRATAVIDCSSSKAAFCTSCSRHPAGTRQAGSWTMLWCRTALSFGHALSGV